MEKIAITNAQVQEIPFPQEPLWKETLQIIRKADSASSFKDAKVIEKVLHFNSQETRVRYGRAIATRFERLDAQTLDCLVDLALAKFPTATLENIWRVLFCIAESLVAKVYLDMIWPRDPGSEIQRTEIRSYTESAFPQKSAKLNQRLSTCFKQAGYLMPHGKQEFIIVGFANLEDSLILATHLLFAHTPRTIKISEIEANPYWKFLGYRKFDHVRIGFRSAEARGLIMRYATADHLEQITTRYSWKDLLGRIAAQ